MQYRLSAVIAIVLSIGGTAVAAQPLPDPDRALPEHSGFRPPPSGAFVTQGLVHWVNVRNGARFVAPTGGWQPPNADWMVETHAVPPRSITGPGDPRPADPKP